MLVALTGGIGSGKSYIMRLFEGLGAKSIYSDKINASLLQEKSYIIGLKKLFPTCFNGETLDKRALRNLIFSSECDRKKLNEYSHAKIMQRIKDSVSKDGITVCEIPLLSEGNFRACFDKIIYVDAPDAVRVRRICERDGVTEEEAAAAIRAQVTERENKNFADYVIINDGDPTDEVRRIYDILCATE